MFLWIIEWLTYAKPAQTSLLKPRKEQKHDMSRFLRGKTKSIMNHLIKKLEEKKASNGLAASKCDLLNTNPTVKI